MNRFVGGLIVGAVALAALGCGSDGGDVGRIQLLEAELETVRLEAQEAEREAEAQREAREAALAAEAAAQAAARQEEAAREQAEQQRDAAQEQISDAQAAAAAAQASAQEAQARAAEIERRREASQRAQYLQAAFPAAAVAVGNSGVTITAPRSGALGIQRGTRFRPATLGGAGLRSVTMPLAQGGDPGKAVVYTDRELSRPLMQHFDDLRDRTNDPSRFNLGHVDIALGTAPVDGSIPHQADAARWRIDHGITPVAGEDDGDPATPVTPVTPLTGAETANTKEVDTHPGYLYGFPGDFVCSGGTNCQVRIVPDFVDADAPVNGEFPVQSVAVTATSGTLHFRPRGSPSIQLWDSGPVGPDLEYMVFGYWREDPRSPASPYRADVFAEVFSTSGMSQALPGESDIYAEYDGIAVGMYVEQEQNDPIDTHRQGEFVADVYLELNGAPLNAATSTTLTGTIDDFVTTPTGGSAPPESSERWVVELNSGGVVVLNNQSGSMSDESGWRHAFVPAHEHAVSAVPPAVTGTFVARHGTISLADRTPDRVDFDALHIVGAFGAHR